MEGARMTRQLVIAFFFVAVCLYTQSNASIVDEIISTISGLESYLSALANLPTLILGALKFFGESAQYRHAEPPDMTPEQNAEYDFIIVGAGSAGAVVASRLTEIPGIKVLLLEAGGSETLTMDIPLLVNYLQFSDKLNWQYRTEPSDSYCLAMEDRRCNWPRGKVLGGSSVLNYMIATRGNYRDYNKWAEMGNTGWSWEDVLYYFKKLENIEIPDLRLDNEMHNTEGLMPINYPRYHTLLAKAFLDAVKELGLLVQDYNTRVQSVGSYIQTNTDNGSRVSSNRAYLSPASQRTNLFVSQDSLVSKILIDPTDNRAVGVQFIKNNQNYTVRARKEVILCAGAIGSAQLLMLSGIGPAEHLAEIGIPLIKDAPVGKNLMDHIAYGGFVVPINTSDSILTKDMVNPLNPYLTDFLNKREGPLTIPGGCEALAFINVDTPLDPNSWPNMELLFEGASLVSDPNVDKDFGITDGFWEQSYKKIEGQHAWYILPMLMRPKSRGEILLKNNDINTPPKLIPNYMSHPEDVRILVAGIRAAQNVTKTQSMGKFGSKLYDVQLPGCEAHLYDSDDYWECALRALTFTIYHFSGTAKMGPEGDPTAVVNPRLKVHGIGGLRVGDAAIIPEIPTAHTNIPVIMIAEKLADMVKEDWDYSTES